MDGNGLLNGGARDALLAFYWVNRNIAALGGDGSKVRPNGRDNLFLLTLFVQVNAIGSIAGRRSF